MSDRILKVGELIVFTVEEKSDYALASVMEVLEEFSYNSIRDEWYYLYTQDHIDPNLYPYGKERLKVKDGGVAFIPYLVSKGLVKPKKYLEINTGGYWSCRLSLREEGVWE